MNINVQKISNKTMQGAELVPDLRNIIHNIIYSLSSKSCTYFQELVFNEIFILFRKLHYITYSLSFNVENNKLLWDNNRELIIDLLSMRFQIIEASNFLHDSSLIDSDIYNSIIQFYQYVQKIVQLNKEAEQEIVNNLQQDTIQ